MRLSRPSYSETLDKITYSIGQHNEGCSREKKITVEDQRT